MLKPLNAYFATYNSINLVMRHMMESFAKENNMNLTLPTSHRK